jgi:hypothetical protein
MGETGGDIMQRILPRFALLALSFAVSIALAAPATATSCRDLTKIAPPDATITSATEETGSFESPKDGLGNTTKVTVPFCRIVGIAKSEPISSIGFEPWLPPEDKWNGRMLASGNLGHSGAPIYPSLNDALTRGFAALGDDLGHQSNAFVMDWAVGHPERIKDWGHRAVISARSRVRRSSRPTMAARRDIPISRVAHMAAAAASPRRSVTLRTITASSQALLAVIGPAFRRPMSSRRKRRSTIRRATYRHQNSRY